MTMTFGRYKFSGLSCPGRAGKMARKLAMKGADSPAWVGWCGMETFAAADDSFEVMGKRCPRRIVVTSHHRDCLFFTPKL